MSNKPTKPKQEELYILRLWQNKEGENWQASLKNMRQTNTKYFQSTNSLKKFLDTYQQTKEVGNPNEKDSKTH